ncbi:MAG: polysulfide reductase NrfD [Acidobacteriota bacterium]
MTLPAAAVQLAADQPPAKGEGAAVERLFQPMAGRRWVAWWALLLVSAGLAAAGTYAAWITVAQGIGLWGVGNQVGWGVAIVTFVFWIGIAHAGTFLSAILHLLHQPWRVAFSRLAEGATLLAVLCAAAFPLIHLGRPWLAFWMFPYPNTRGSLWVNFRSPLTWDFVAIGTYFIISLLFFYLGLLPDLAALRERLPEGLRRRACGWLALGWDGRSRLWVQWRRLYSLIAGLAAALVISVHSIVSWDFAVSLVPGWHSTIFPPYFVVGAVFSGLAMVILLVLAFRRLFGFGDLVPTALLEPLAKLLLACSLFLGLVYAAEFFHAYYGGEVWELAIIQERWSGTMSVPFLATVVGNVALPQLLWFRRWRRSSAALGLVAAGVTVAMWWERYVIVIGSLQRDFLPPNWTLYVPTLWELGPILASIGWFAAGLLLLFRAVPPVSPAEWWWQRLQERLPESWREFPPAASGERDGLGRETER